MPPGRSIPKLNKIPLRRWHRLHANKNGPFANGRVLLFCDEFTNFNDAEVGIKTVQLLNRLGYEVIIPRHVDSGRAQISKGLLRDAAKLATRNVELLKDVVTSQNAACRDRALSDSRVSGTRFPILFLSVWSKRPKTLGANALLIDEFISARPTQVASAAKRSLKSPGTSNCTATATKSRWLPSRRRSRLSNCQSITKFKSSPPAAAGWRDRLDMRKSISTCQ